MTYYAFGFLDHVAAEEAGRGRLRPKGNGGGGRSSFHSKQDHTVQDDTTPQVREMAHGKMFGRPGNGAPTVDIRKKKFTEHQLDKDVKKGEELNM